MSQHAHNTAAPTSGLSITYDEQTFDFAAFPPATVTAVLRRGLSHLFGSEAASKVQNMIEKGICEGSDAADTEARTTKFEGLATSDRRAAIKAFRDANPELVAKWLQEVRAGYKAAMVAGTLGVSVRGPSVDPLTTVVNRLAKAEVTNVLRANKTAIPKKAEDAVEFPNGDKFTIGQLVERRKAHATHGPRLIKEAKAHIAAQERAAAKAGEAGLADL